MKIRSIFIVAAAGAALFTAGCSHKQAGQSLSRTQAVKKIQKPFTSGQMVESMQLNNGTSSQTISQSTVFGGKTPVFHSRSQVQANGKSQGIETWLDQNSLYIQGRGNWYKAGAENTLGYNYSDMSTSTLNNPLLQDPSSALKKSYRMSKKGSSYVLSAKVNDKSVMKTEAANIMTTLSQSKKQAQMLTQMLKYGKCSDMRVKGVLKNGKLYRYSVTLKMKVTKAISLNLKQEYGNFGSHEFLRLPVDAGSAKPLPKQH